MAEERRLAAIMFADICGFSRIMGQDEKRALAIVDLAVSCVQSGADEYGGRVIKRLGDGALVEFSSAVNAVRSALEVQQAIARHNARSEPEEQFQIRIGIHVGDVVVSEGDIMGDGVNVASRIEPLAEPGGICISRDVFDLVRSKVDIEAVNLGPMDLKNISRQVDIYRLLLAAVDGSRVQRPPPAVSPAGDRAGDRGRSNRRAWLVGIGGAILTVLLLLGVGDRNRRAKAEYERLTREARQAMDEGRVQDAEQALKSYPKEFKKTPHQAGIDDALKTVRRRAAEAAIRQRQKEFFLAVQNNHEDAALGVIDPAVVTRVGPKALWTRLRMTAGLLKLVRMDAESLAIDRVEISFDGREATVHLRAWIQTPENPAGEWKPIPSTEWREIEGVWYLAPPDGDRAGSGRRVPRPERSRSPE